MTSDERREIAARLRDYAQLRNCYPFEAFYVRLNIALFGDNGWDRTDGDVFERLADLIDQTCEMEPMPTCVPHHRFSRWRCRKCGLVSFTPFNATGPRYCPYCGHRWVTRDDQ
jgi:rubrerythrin